MTNELPLMLVTKFIEEFINGLNRFFVLVIPRCKNVQIDVIINYKPLNKKINNPLPRFFFNF